MHTASSAGNAGAVRSRHAERRERRPRRPCPPQNSYIVVDRIYDHYLRVAFALPRLQINLPDWRSTRSGYFGFPSSRRDRNENGPPAVADGALNSLASVQIDFEWATKLNRLTLSAIGLWPNARGDARGRLLSDLRVWFSVLLFVSVGAIPAIHSLVRTRSDMMATVDNLQFTLPLLTTTMKVTVLWWKRTDLALVLDMTADDWSRTKTALELRVMTRRARHARAISMFGYVLMTMGFILLAILPCFGKSMRYRTNVTDPGRALPLQTHYLYDKNRSPYFELTFAGQALLILIAGASYSGVDNLLGLLVFHLCGQMENLKERLIHVKPFGEGFDSGLAAVVQDHIRYFDTVERIFTLLLLALLFYFGTLFCLYGFLIITMLREGRQMSMMRLVYLISVALNFCGHMCLYCLVGEILVQQCKGLHQAAFDYEWYTLEPRKARTMILIMIRASKPLYITAGKMFPMTMSMFCNLIKTSGGYVSVLLARQGL